MPLQLACIADDITGASDLALTLASHGMSVTQVMGVPTASVHIETDAAVIALKIRTAPVDQAVQQATEAAHHLLRLGAHQLYFKYCSTFDSTPVGNIGPVTDALLDCVDEGFTVVCPAFPANQRTIRGGVLYVGGVPLAESSMRYHPLTPMTCSSLLELMDQQTAPGASGLVELDCVRRGVEAVRHQFDVLRGTGKRYAVLDCEQNADLITAAAACKDLKLITGASALAMGLPGNFQKTDSRIHKSAFASIPTDLAGHPVVLAGSCSETTRKQVAYMSRTCATIVIDPQALHRDQAHLQQLQEQAIQAWQKGSLLIYSSAESEQVKQAQQLLGFSESAELVEQALGSLAASLANSGACQFIIAGGETSAAVAAALQVKQLHTGPKIDEGIPWMIASGDRPMVLAFKSGNFGREDFFIKAMAMLAESSLSGT
ncbi:MAG: 3-oxo-tetronate kinase [Xanthomonadales bacterium]|nr:3-oxo-tetronate kinase [Xanthomonadales bacterium]